MDLLHSLKAGKTSYSGEKASNVNINLGDGNSQITVRGDGVNIHTGVGNQSVVVLGNDVDIELDQGALADYDFDQDFDTVAVVSDKGNVSINTGNGNDTAVAVADNVNIKMGEGNVHNVVYWGDNVDVELGDAGYNTVMSADRALTGDDNLLGKTLLNENFTVNGVNVGQAAVNRIEDATRQVENFWAETSAGSTDKTSFLKSMQKQYNLDSANMKELERLYDNGELFETFRGSDGTEVSKYAIMKSVVQKNADGSLKYVLAKVDSANSSGYMHTWGFKNGSYSECIATTKVQTANYKIEEKAILYRETYNQLDGTKNLRINLGTANQNVIDVTAIGEVSIDGDNINAGGSGNFVRVGSARRTESEIEAKEVTALEARMITGKEVQGSTGESAKTASITGNATGTYTSPLVLDMNKDGVVSAKSGNGVDVNGDGIADGYATNGDKMLAMSDLTGNGKVDGAEVFGDKTISPFTGKALNAANGFEALKLLAKEAEANTGVSCYNNGKVDLQALKAALATVGVNLGYISDANTTNLEALEAYDVASITVDEYDEKEDTGAVQHRQQGTYTTADGRQQAVDDVWFKNRSMLDKLIGNK